MTTPRPPSAIRGHTSIDTKTGEVPGLNTRFAPPDAPIDLPDYYEHDFDQNEGTGVIALIAIALLGVFAIAALMIFGVKP